MITIAIPITNKHGLYSTNGGIGNQDVQSWNVHVIIVVTATLIVSGHEIQDLPWSPVNSNPERTSSLWSIEQENYVVL